MEPSWAITLTVLAALLPASLLLLLLYALTKRFLLPSRTSPSQSQSTPSSRRHAALQRSALMASLWRSHLPLRAFHWSDHPSLVLTALEHGWTAFPFSYAASALAAFVAGPVHQMWDMCGACTSLKFLPPELGWVPQRNRDDREVWDPESCLHLQQVRLNPGLRGNKDGCVLPVQAVQTALPVPGPVLGPCPFPQEAYFEVVVVASGTARSEPAMGSERGERVKLIAKTVTMSTEDLLRQHAQDPEKGVKDGGGESEVVIDPETDPGEEIDWDELVSVGLAGAEAPPFRLLGFDPGSVGFLSADGQCYVNGMPYTQGKDIPPSKPRPWGAVKTTVGCGFDPKLRRVFFTLNGELVHEAFLKSSDFSNPLYPTIASNYDVTVLVNLGQMTFEYVPANITRVANPCCHILQATMPFKSTSFFDDDVTADLFSMGRFDSHWLAELEYANAQEQHHQYGHSEAESDLFEIVLDGHHGLKR